MTLFFRSIVLSAVLFLGSCQTPSYYVPGSLKPQDKVSVSVLDVDVIDGDTPQEDQSTQWLESSLRNQVKGWFADRFQPTGGEQKAYVVVHQASIKETVLPQEAGSKTWLTKQQSERYDVVVEVSFELRDDVGFPTQSALAKAERSFTVLEGATLQERQARLQKTVNALLVDLDQSLLQNMRNFLPLLLQQQ